MVFLESGLALGLFMVAATLIGFWLWWTEGLGRFTDSWSSRHPYLVVFLLLCLAITVLLTKSLGAILLAAAGAVVLVCSARLKTSLPLLALLLVAPTYITARASGAWSGADLAPWLAEYVSEQRVSSFEFRTRNEDMLLERAFEGPPLGWGGWGRSLVYGEGGRQLSIPDGMWIIVLGDRGVPGLIVLYAAMLLPVLRFLWLLPRSGWSDPLYSGAVACAVVIVLFMTDNLMNFMQNHVFIVMAGALAGLSGFIAPQSTRAVCCLPDMEILG